MKATRIYCDADGTSHFEDVDFELTSADYAPPAPPLEVSESIPVSGAVLASFRAGWFGDWHPTPRRQLYFQLSGQLEVGVSDGEVRILGPGDIVLVEDVIAPGHTTRALGDDASTGVFVHLADEEGTP
jgi:quercetin dioxygenase-like cupin family protein